MHNDYCLIQKEGCAGRDQVLTDLMDGQFSDPVRVIAFNTGTDHARDVSREFADAILSEHSHKGLEIPAFLESFIERAAAAAPAATLISPGTKC